MTIHVKLNGKVVMKDEDEEDSYTLVLSKEAAKALKYACGSITGGFNSTQRKYTSAIYTALHEAGISTSDYKKVVTGNITFLK